MLRNIKDSIQEGDGERIIRCWKYFTFIFKGSKHHDKYALAGLRIIADGLALLTPKKFHQLTWNRFINNHGKIGRCIAKDLRNEHLNYIAKQHIRSLGYSNITNENVTRLSKTIGCMESVIELFGNDFCVSKKEGKERNAHFKSQFEHILQEVQKADFFSLIPGRNLTGLPNFKGYL